jgi:Leucine-rich repeat (LRR) protein
LTVFKISGSNGINTSRLSHIAELDLTDNLISEWSEVLKLLAIFRSLKFLNLSNNLLSDKLRLSPAEQSVLSPLPLRKLVLNGNKLDWMSIHQLTSLMPHLEELHLSNNALPNPNGDFRHKNIRRLFLTCNEIDSFEDVYQHLVINTLHT